MMLRSFYSLLGALCLLLATGVAAHGAEPKTQRYWVFFTNKGPAAAVMEASERAQMRRALRGTPGVDPALDRPVATAYIEALATRGVQPLVVSRWLNGISALLTEAQVRAIEALPFVRRVQPVATLTTSRHAAPTSAAGPASSRPPSFGPSRRQLEVMNAIGPLERGINGAGVRLGFLDTEFGDFQHPAFDRLRQEGRLIADSIFAQARQTDRHGQMVASTAVGYWEDRLVGPAHGAEVVAATTEYAPTETNQEEDAFVAGLEWLESMGVDVVNTSLGYHTFDPGNRSYTYADLNGDTGVTTRAVDIAASLGVVVVASAGNDGWCTAQTPVCWYYIGTPADADTVVAVGAVTFTGTRALFSSFGPTADGRIKPDVAAAGEGVVAAGTSFDGTPTLVSVSGTSFSSPLVAGVVCQVLQVNPLLTPVEVRDILRNTASQASTPDNALGWGIVDADAAVREAERRVVSVEDPARQGRQVTLFPNPTHQDATLRLDAAGGEAARLTLYDATGRVAAVPFEGTLQPGPNEITIPARNLPSGVYLYVLRGEHLHVAGRLVVSR